MAGSAGNKASTPAGKRRAARRVGDRQQAHPRGKPHSPAGSGAGRSKPKRRPTKPPRSRAPRPKRARRRRTRPVGGAGFSWPQRLTLLACALAVLVAGYLLWLRDSSLVAVTNVEVTGVTSNNRDAIAAELTRTAEGMTTLHADPGRLEAAVAAFPTVKSVGIEMDFPHGARIEVVERPPVLFAAAGGERVPVAADGTLLPGVEVPDENLPELGVEKLPPQGRLEGDALEQALVAGAAPPELRGLIEGISRSDRYGVEVTLRGGIPVRFGDPSEAAAKWKAAAAVLADPDLDTLCSLDVRVPGRPAAGCAAPDGLG